MVAVKYSAFDQLFRIADALEAIQALLTRLAPAAKPHPLALQPGARRLVIEQALGPARDEDGMGALIELMLSVFADHAGAEIERFIAQACRASELADEDLATTLQTLLLDMPTQTPPADPLPELQAELERLRAENASLKTPPKLSPEEALLNGQNPYGLTEADD